jgi:hypothetical protein
MGESKQHVEIQNIYWLYLHVDDIQIIHYVNPSICRNGNSYKMVWQNKGCNVEHVSVKDPTIPTNALAEHIPD